MTTTSKQPQHSNGQIQRVEVVREIQPSSADVDVLAVIERRNALLEKVLAYAIASTHSGQWFDNGGKPWPSAPAAEVMARRCAVRIENVHTEKVPSSDDKGPFYMYVSTCTASLPGGFDSLQGIGTCSSRDTFLGTETRAGRVLSEIDEGNILKAAYSNMLVNAVTRLLGVRNLSWEQLEKYGIKHGDVKTVDYHSGAKGGAATERAASGGEVTIKYGSAKGTPVSKLSDKDLAYYLKNAKESVAKNDPKWHQKNVEMHDALEAERKRRQSAPRVDPQKLPITHPDAEPPDDVPPPGDDDYHP